MRGFSSMGFLKKFTKQEISWMMYDWACYRNYRRS